jgi:hypothetical protein
MNDSNLEKQINFSTLKQSCENSILELQEIVKVREVRFKKNGNIYYVGDTLEKIKLCPCVMEIVIKHPPSVAKYNNIIPSNVKELLEYTSKLSQVIIRLNTTLKFWRINDNLSKRYVEELLDFMYKLSSFKRIDKKSEEYKSHNASQLISCALCYEPVKTSAMSTCYCEYHSIKKNQQTDRIALLNLIRNSNTPEKKTLLANEKINKPIKCIMLSYFLKNLSPDIFYQINHDVTNKLWREDWTQYVTYIIELVKKNYPLSFDKIKRLKIEDFNSFNAFMNAFEVALCNRPAINNWLGLENDFLDIENNHLHIELILAMVRRVESYFLYKVN